MAIFLSAGHHLKDSGAVSNGYQENLLAIDLRNLVVTELDILDPLLKVIIDNEKETLRQYLNRIKPGNGSVVVELHFNSSAPSATGTEVIVSDASSQNSKDLAREIVEATSNILGIKNRGVKKESETPRGKLPLTRKTGITCLPEICFMSNKEDMKKYQSNKYLLAKKFATLLKKYDDLIK